jgi:hypothetical protein
MAYTSSANIPQVLDPATAEIFLDGLIRLGDMTHMEWMRVRSAATKTLEVAAIDPPGAYQPHTEGQEFSFSAVEEGYSKTYTQSELALAFQLSAYSYHFMDKTALAEFVQQLGASYGRKLSALGYAVLSGGFSDSGPDGVSLFSASHPAKVGGNQSNTGSVALSESSLQTALTAMRRLKTPDNILASSVPQYLIVPPELEYTAKELVGSEFSGADMQTNVLSTKGLTVLVAPDLSDANDFMLIDPVQFRAYQYIAKGSNPKQWIDMDSDNYRISDRVIVTQGYDSWRGAWGASVA